ncbi:hypothetical protein ATANTOWER_031497 [Ataeniobius toweri]|uniref:Uncharacterized protein n=1 Tax=Ataeniobius toweri TaxID=208326 RepID=A0ABU7B9X2_9TELE|nr:hypothetical protein [Ataeniobius toweri]
MKQKHIMVCASVGKRRKGWKRIICSTCPDLGNIYSICLHTLPHKSCRTPNIPGNPFFITLFSGRFRTPNMYRHDSEQCPQLWKCCSDINTDNTDWSKDDIADIYLI